MIHHDKIISNNHLPNLVILTRQSSMWITRTILAWTTMSQCQSPLTILPWPTPSQRPPPRQLAARGYPPLDLDSTIAAPITTPSSPHGIAPQRPTGGTALPPAITLRRCPPPHMESTASPPSQPLPPPTATPATAAGTVVAATDQQGCDANCWRRLFSQRRSSSCSISHNSLFGLCRTTQRTQPRRRPAVTLHERPFSLVEQETTLCFSQPSWLTFLIHLLQLK